MTELFISGICNRQRQVTGDGDTDKGWLLGPA